MTPSIKELLQARIDAKAEDKILKEEHEARVAKNRQDQQQQEAERLVATIGKAIEGDLESALCELEFTVVPSLEPAGILTFNIPEMDSRFRIVCTKPSGSGLVWKMDEFVPGQDHPFRQAPRAEGHMDLKKMQEWVLDFIQTSIDHPRKQRH